MLQIDIVGFNGDDLKLEVGGRPNNGSSPAKRNEDVHWKVKQECGVASIKSIAKKQMHGSQDIFPAGSPSPQDPGEKHWKGKILSGAVLYSVYIYKIVWQKEGENFTRTFDPIISIRPKLLPNLQLLLVGGITMVSLVGYLLYKIYLLTN